MNGAGLLLIAAVGAVRAWTEPPMAKILPGAEPPTSASTDMRLYAAQGERESFQICLRADKKGAEHVEIAGGTVGKDIGAPEMHLVGYLRTSGPSPRALGPGEYWPDPLLELEPFDIPPNETRAVWVTYTVPEDATPGAGIGGITVTTGKGEKLKVGVRIEVFNFALPQSPSLSTLFLLRRRAIRDVYGLDDGSLDSWKPIYDALAGYRISYSLWSDGDLVQVSADGSSHASRFEEHAAYAAAEAKMRVIDVGKGPVGVSMFPEPGEGEVQDPLQLYLYDVGAWLQQQGWLDRACVQGMGIGDRDRWEEIRKSYFRVQRADRRFRRVMTGGLHPYFERYTDIWAVPVRFLDLYGCARLQSGYSLAGRPFYGAHAVTASSQGGPAEGAPFECRAEDGYDGSLITYWLSKSAPSKSRKQWFQIDLVEKVRTDRFRVGWRNGYEGTDVQVRTSLDGRMFSLASVRWEYHMSDEPLVRSWSEGAFRSKKSFVSLRFEVRQTRLNTPVAITEVEFGKPPLPESVERIEPVEVWLCGDDASFPSFAVDVDAAEARAFPWVCWGCRADGFKGGTLNDWPAAWSGSAQEQPLVWENGGTAQDFLFYPGRRGLIPSIRVELLRDGLEDYEYLAALAHAVEIGLVKEREVVELGARALYPWDLPAGGVSTLAERMTSARLKIGRALTLLNGTNFKGAAKEN